MADMMVIRQVVIIHKMQPNRGVSMKRIADKAATLLSPLKASSYVSKPYCRQPCGIERLNKDRMLRTLPYR